MEIYYFNLLCFVSILPTENARACAPPPPHTHSVKSSAKVETINAKRVSICDSHTESLIFTPNMNQVLGLAG